MLLRFHFLLLLLSFAVVIIPANASPLSVEHFKSIGHDIDRNPHPVYLQLLDIEKRKEQLSPEAYLWLLYRKAHAENLLYFFDDFEQTVEQVVALIDEKTSVEITSAIYVYKGMAAQQQGKYAEAEKYLKLAMSLAQEANLNHIYTVAKQEFAYNQSLKGLYEVSLTDLQEAYVEAYAMEDNFLIAIINEVYGAVFGYMEEYEKSIEYYTKALDTYERLGYKPYVAEAVYGLASTYRDWKQYDKAIEKFELYREKIAFTPNQDISFFGAYGLGMTYAEKGDCTKALAIINEALTLNGIIDYNAELYKKKAICKIAQGDLVSAQKSLEQAENIFKTIPELDGTTWTLGVLKIKAQLYFARQQYQQSYLTAVDYYEKINSLVKKNASKQLIKVRAAMELERQDVELSLLQQRNKVQMLKLSQQEQANLQQLYLLAAGGVILLMVLILVFVQYQNNKKIFALSITDPLSNLFNRRYIFNYLERLIKNTATRHGELSVLLFDIDDFKQVNDVYGHPFGDDVIKQVADITLSTLRVGDVVGRIGGEEFLCILPRADVQQAKQIANRLKENIHKALFLTDNREDVNITVSVGISVYDEETTEDKSLYIQADKALYQAKQQGKNQVVIYSESLS